MLYDPMLLTRYTRNGKTYTRRVAERHGPAPGFKPKPRLVRFDVELDEEVRFCYDCDEWWPQDDAFWDPKRLVRCRACEAERKMPRQLRDP